MTEPAQPFGTMPQEPCILERLINQTALFNPTAGNVHPCKLQNKNNIGELKQLWNKNDPPFTQAVINS